MVAVQLAESYGYGLEEVSQRLRFREAVVRCYAEQYYTRCMDSQRFLQYALRTEDAVRRAIAAQRHRSAFANNASQTNQGSAA
jgi:hypothetical protein